jgi:hypothetical protein
MLFFSPHICYKCLVHPSFLDFTAMTVEWTVSASLCIILIYSKHLSFFSTNIFITMLYSSAYSVCCFLSGTA